MHTRMYASACADVSSMWDRGRSTYSHGCLAIVVNIHVLVQCTPALATWWGAFK